MQEQIRLEAVVKLEQVEDVNGGLATGMISYLYKYFVSILG